MKRTSRLFLTLLPAMLLAAWTVSGFAQVKVQAKTQPKVEQRTPKPPAPDRQAFTEANAVREPDKKIEAMEKFLKDFPDSSMAYQAHQAIFSSLVQNHPDQQSRILEQAGKAVEKASDAIKVNLYNTLSSQLLDADILLSEAERFASLGLQAVENNAAQQTNPNMQARMESAKANLQVTLGSIFVKQGKLDEAEKNLDEALNTNPRLTAASLGLAEIHAKRGNKTKALFTYIDAAVSGKIPAASRQQLNDLYANFNNGSLAGLEEMLDAKYLVLNPMPFEAEPYKPNRVTLLEVFTGSGCPPCVAADLAADLAVERYGADLAMLVYHEHIPRPDPMTTPQTTARFRYYEGRGVPTLGIDGVTASGGGGRDATRRVYDRITKEIEKQLGLTADADIQLSAVLDGSTVKANAVVNSIQGESSDLRLHIVLAEEKLRYIGENGIRFHPMVVRSMAETDAGQGLIIEDKKSQSFNWNFDLDAISTAIKKHLDEYEAGGHRGSAFTFTEKKYEIDPKELVVVAFVQDEKTKSILQSIRVKVNP